MKLHVNLGENSYDIVIEKGLLKKASEEIREVVFRQTNCSHFR